MKLERYPFTTNDVDNFRINQLTQWAQASHEACFDLCEQNNELTFMSIEEGSCMRNCVSKLNFMTPYLNKRL